MFELENILPLLLTSSILSVLSVFNMPIALHGVLQSYSAICSFPIAELNMLSLP